MRALPTLALLSLLGAGCTPNIPVKADFGTSALTPSGTIPPEFALFNNYDPRVNALLADQVCATPYIPELDRPRAAAPGDIIAANGRCSRYAITLDNLREHFSP